MMVVSIPAVSMVKPRVNHAQVMAAKIPVYQSTPTYLQNVLLERRIEVVRLIRDSAKDVRVSKAAFLPKIEREKLTAVAKPAKMKKVKAVAKDEPAKAYLYRAMHCKLGAGVVISEDSDRIAFVADGTDNVRVLLKSIGAAGMLTKI